MIKNFLNLEEYHNRSVPSSGSFSNISCSLLKQLKVYQNNRRWRPKLCYNLSFQKLHWTSFKESMWFLSVPPLITRIYPSTHQAPPNIRKSEIVISPQPVVIEKLSISAIKSNFVLLILNSSFGFVGDPVRCAVVQKLRPFYWRGGFGLFVELPREGSASAACAAGLLHYILHYINCKVFNIFKEYTHPQVPFLFRTSPVSVVLCSSSSKGLCDRVLPGWPRFPWWMSWPGKYGWKASDTLAM